MADDLENMEAFVREGVVRAVIEIPAGTTDKRQYDKASGTFPIDLRDGLAGKPGGTYGGGRYLLDTVKGADLGAGADDDSIILDFNFAYNPSCAYDPMWACPLPQSGNTVAADVPVGELAPGEERHPTALVGRPFNLET